MPVSTHIGKVEGEEDEAEVEDMEDEAEDSQDEVAEEQREFHGETQTPNKASCNKQTSP